MSDIKRCDVCKKDFEDGMDIKQVIIARIGTQVGEKLDVCGKCEKLDPKAVAVAEKQARKRVAAQLTQQARQTAAAQGRVAGYKGNIPPMLGPDGKPVTRH